MNDSLTHTIRRLFSLYEVPHGHHQTIAPLEGIRAIAAFMVFVVHYCAQFTPWIIEESTTSALISHYRHIGSKGVELFFIISGFLIYGMLISKARPFTPYIKRRIQRLYPTFLVVLFLYIGLSFAFPHESKLPADLLQGIIYVLANIFMLPGMFPIEAIVTVSWSLSYELFFYLFIPVMIGVLQLRQWSRLHRISFLLSAACCGYLLTLLGFDSHSEMLLFIAGMLTYEIYQSGKNHHRITSSWFFPVTIALLVLFKLMNVSKYFDLLLLFVGFSLACLSCFDTRTVLSKLCSSPLLRCYGNMSYSYYLIHGLTLKFFFFILAMVIPAHHQWDVEIYLFVVPVFFLTWISSTLLFIGVEKPLSLAKTHKPTPVKMEY
ncbi:MULTISPECIES: acyltransferase family protein [Vibrio]|uniref:Acyltransferase family protein n=2 Tax=Vibrio TaxID=662 RepID=A0A7X4LPJ0_9VIBR|nr:MULTISPECIES: acyltransferase [Vibrio]MBF9002155.1 acyltransferase [Vibrio nitrifigilis]MZI95540.1 acyltransferase family protein [Vibrio eleionomae]